MTIPSDSVPTVLSLRERKKIKTRIAIQEQAFRLFRDKGYSETTVEQIAEAAEVSPSTFFRYFPSKEDVALYDSLDPVLFDAFLNQPPELSPIQALRASLKTTLASLSTNELALLMERGRLSFSVPELRLKFIENQLLRSWNEFAAVIAKRVGRSPEDLAIQAFLGSVIGAILPVLLQLYKDPKIDVSFLERVDACWAHLENGLKL